MGAFSPGSDGGEQRRDPRFPAWIEATLHRAATQDWQEAMIVDVSLGGAGVQVFAPLQNAVAGEVMLLTFEWRLRFCELECTLVGQSDGSIHPLVHLQWADLSWKSVRQLQLMANYLRDAA